MTSEQTIEALRDAVIEAARVEDLCNLGECDCGILGGPFCEDVLRDALKALDDALKPDPLRDAVELLRRLEPELWPPSPNKSDVLAFLAEYDQRDGAA